MTPEKCTIIRGNNNVIYFIIVTHHYMENQNSIVNNIALKNVTNV